MPHDSEVYEQYAFQHRLDWLVHALHARIESECRIDCEGYFLRLMRVPSTPYPALENWIAAAVGYERVDIVRLLLAAFPYNVWWLMSHQWWRKVNLNSQREVHLPSFWQLSLSLSFFAQLNLLSTIFQCTTTTRRLPTTFKQCYLLSIVCIEYIINIHISIHTSIVLHVLGQYCARRPAPATRWLGKHVRRHEPIARLEHLQSWFWVYNFCRVSRTKQPVPSKKIWTCHVAVLAQRVAQILLIT